VKKTDSNSRALLLSKIEEYFLKRLEADKIYWDLKNLRKEIYKIKKISKNDEDEEFKVNGGEVFWKKYVSEYTSILKKEFTKLPIEEKRNLYKQGLLNLTFKLNYKKYKKIKDKGEKNILDGFVYKRKDNYPYYLNIKKEDPNIIKGYYESPEELEAYEDEIYNNILDNIYPLESSYFTDDDYAELPDNEKDMLGIDRDDEWKIF